MRKSLYCILGGLLLMVTGASSICAQGDIVSSGKALYEKNCVMCHGNKGDGNGPASAVLTTRPANFTNPGFWQTDVEKKVFETLKSGRGLMPAFNLKTEEVQSIIEYLKYLKTAQR
jgi:mono/diheme cytochrome c family protein